MRGGAMEYQAFSPEQIQQAIQKYEDWARRLAEPSPLIPVAASAMSDQPWVVKPSKTRVRAWPQSAGRERRASPCRISRMRTRAVLL
jgi:hypothetical protein